MPEPTLVLALDAMGVLYRAYDDVAELLVPFVAAQGGTRDVRLIEDVYRRTSLGELSADELWARVGLAPELEDDYLAGHELVPGLTGFLRDYGRRFALTCCISNDVARWSRKLRRRFGLETYVSQWFISGEVGARKPDPTIYRTAFDALGVPARRFVFVEDRVKNVLSARSAGMTAVLFGSKDGSVDGPAVRDFAELGALCETLLTRAALQAAPAAPVAEPLRRLR